MKTKRRLTDDQAQIIREMRTCGFSQRELAHLFNVSSNVVSRIVRRTGYRKEAPAHRMPEPKLHGNDLALAAYNARMRWEAHVQGRIVYRANNDIRAAERFRNEFRQMWHSVLGSHRMTR